MRNPLEILFYGSPIDATHARPYPGGIDYYKRENGKWLFIQSGKWERAYCTSENDCVERPIQNKQWSGPQDGLPPIGLEIEIKIDFKKAPPYVIITLTELGVDVQKQVPRFQKVKVLYASSKYLVADACGAECLTPMSCVELRAIKTDEQLAAEQRETAIAEMAKVLPGAKHECWTCNPDGSVKPYENTYEILGLLVDAGFKLEVV